MSERKHKMRCGSCYKADFESGLRRGKIPRRAQDTMRVVGETRNGVVVKCSRCGKTRISYSDAAKRLLSIWKKRQV